MERFPKTFGIYSVMAALEGKSYWNSNSPSITFK